MIIIFLVGDVMRIAIKLRKMSMSPRNKSQPVPSIIYLVFTEECEKASLCFSRHLYWLELLSKDVGYKDKSHHHDDCDIFTDFIA